jgi:hypothetical protein
MSPFIESGLCDCLPQIKEQELRETMAKAEGQSPVNGAGGWGVTRIPRPEDLGYREGTRPGFPGLKTWATEKGPDLGSRA